MAKNIVCEHHFEHNFAYNYRKKYKSLNGKRCKIENELAKDYIILDYIILEEDKTWKGKNTSSICK